jgi:hypothetical protein
MFSVVVKSLRDFMEVLNVTNRQETHFHSKRC